MSKSLEEVLARAGAIVTSPEHEGVVSDRMSALVAQAARQERAARLDAELVPLTPSMREAVLADVYECETGSLRAVRLWLAAPRTRPTLVLAGVPGVGKSVAAAHALANTRASLWRTAQDLSRLYGSSSLSARDEMVLLRRCSLLVVDDVGAESERLSPLLCIALTDLIGARQGRRTVITLNMSRDAFNARYSDERLMSRMVQSVDWLADPGRDLRKAQG